MNSMPTNGIATLLSESVAAHRQGNLKRAAAGYQRVLDTDPDNATATQLLGTIALQTLQYPKARTLLTKATELDPTNGTTLHNLARLDELESQLPSAADNYRRAFELMPDNTDTSFSLANVLASLGRLEDSERWYRKTLELDPAYAPAHRQIARLLDHDSVDSDVQAMEQQMSLDGVSDTSRMHLAFGLGKAYEDMGRYKDAFGYFEIANTLKRAQLRFDIRNWGAEIDRVTATFSTDLFEQFSGSGKKGAQPIFILGMPRSGTSLVEQILASHTSVFGGGELQTLNLSIMSAMDVSKFPSNVASLDRDALLQMAGHYLSKTAEMSQGASRVTDKKPDNFKLIGMIKLVFPDAVIIHTHRNPLDNCLSLYKNHFSDNGPFYSYDQKELATYYLGYKRLMAHWESVLPGFIHNVEYEALVADPETGVRSLLEKAGLDYEPACLEFHRTSRSVRTASAVQVRKPIYSSSVELWRRYEEQLQPLISVLSGARST